ncbi:multiple sugar transport system permease protein [Paenibacillus sp. PvP094]|uniref:carbohydrate ABC transporter permease n=1 Tax=Paenibacillus sp. PvP094 TaxID=3156394 RepID=UPI00339362C9
MAKTVLNTSVSEQSLQSIQASKKESKLLDRIVSYILLVFMSILFLLPFIWLIGTSLKPEAEAISYPPSLIPKEVDWKNYAEVFELVPFLKFYQNTIIVTLTSVVGTVFSSALVGYGFARINGKGRNFWFMMLLATMMLPSQVTMIPVYLIFAKLGWINTFLPLIVPSFFGSAYFIFLLRQFFRTIPKELDEAAIIDGCGPFRIFWNIMLPLIVPSLLTVAILSFMGSWNDFFGPLIYLNDTSKFTLSLGIQTFKGQNTMLWGPMMAASTMVITPLVVLFFFAQKYFVQGIATSGLKG